MEDSPQSLDGFLGSERAAQGEELPCQGRAVFPQQLKPCPGRRCLPQRLFNMRKERVTSNGADSSREGFWVSG